MLQIAHSQTACKMVIMVSTGSLPKMQKCQQALARTFLTLNSTQLNSTNHLQERWLTRGKKLIAYIYPRFLNKQSISALKVLTMLEWIIDIGKLFHSSTRECGNYSDVLPLKAARRDSNWNLTSCEASNLSCRQIQCRFI